METEAGPGQVHKSLREWLNLVGFKHCVDFAGVFRDEDYIAFVMGLAEAGLECYIPGRALEEALQPIAVEFLFAVARLHRFGSKHLERSCPRCGGPLYLIDYSMATTQRFHTGPACGKASYIAPEMHLGHGYDAFQADAFSCGVILYALFAKDKNRLIEMGCSMGTCTVGRCWKFSSCEDYPWISTRAGACKCFEYVRNHGFLKFMSKRRIMVGNEKKPVQQALLGSFPVMSTAFVHLLDGLLRFNPEADTLREVPAFKVEDASTAEREDTSSTT
eukprot:Skav229629  [mRNA]  locus=scaffold649:135039:140211:- [translate_table: standard]